MARTITLKPSRTFALAAFGLLSLALIAVGLFIALGAYMAAASTTDVEAAANAQAVTALVGALQVVAGCIAAVAGGGAGSMALRDYGSRGLTSSQAPQVLVGRTMGPPQAAARAPGPAGAPTPAPAAVEGPEEGDPDAGQ